MGCPFTLADDFRMKILLIKIIKVLSVLACVGLVGYGLEYVSSDENSMSPSIRSKPNDWGIAKDNPLHFSRF